MSFELFFARTWVVLAAGLALFIAGAGAAVFRIYFRRWRDGKDATFDTHAWTALTVATILEMLLFAVLDVGQAFALVTDGWGAIVGICGTLLMPILGYKAIAKVTSTKGGPTDVTGGNS